ncbi:hypothetical protein G7Z17_g2959 [Cylindrodendrum hubeiense]|uniref:Maleylacetoacetate isomerase n=1 Tax=Cylindrodendrum hubeiense TaxID=595255 RepID=A0A9P5HIT1_9HYPO|nr:hypothetical protein G7Z17_g2959 [Cylindrodendrum hubeiense]
MAVTLSEQVTTEQLGPGEYVSKLCPIRMGNALPIAYGGCTAAVAVSAACSTVPENLSLYSVLGHFLGPASIDQKLYCSVTNTRDTRSFATRRVQVKQKQKDGTFRVCLELLADFHVQEPSLLTYSAPPESTWPRPDDCPTAQAQAETLKARGVVTESQYQEFVKSFGVAEKFFEARYCVNGVAGQTLAGVSKHTTTTQDQRHITAKTSAEWQRTREPLSSPAENLGALSFLMDGALSFLPLTHNHLWFEDTAACSTLDFALRIFTPDIKMDAWHLRERTTSRGGSGRTFSEGKLWDEQDYTLYSYFRSSCSTRLRIALNLKSIPYETVPVNLLKNEQMSDEHKAINPSASVPVLVCNQSQTSFFKIGQSVAALEYLDERHPETPLLPPLSDLEARSLVRSLVEIVCTDIQPVTNLRIMRRVRVLGGNAEEWNRQLMTDGLRAYEVLAEKSAGKYSVADEVSMADACLIPAVWNAERFGVDISQFPTVERIAGNLKQHPAVIQASYFNQPDTPEELRTK